MNTFSRSPNSNSTAEDSQIGPFALREGGPSLSAPARTVSGRRIRARTSRATVARRLLECLEVSIGYVRSERTRRSAGVHGHQDCQSYLWSSRPSAVKQNW